MNNAYQDDVLLLSDDELISEIRKGKDELLSVIFSRYRHTVDFFASGFSSSPWEKDDLVQEGLIALYSAIRLYDYSSASFATFASVCIKRGMISALRQSNKARHVPKDKFLLVDDITDKSVEGPEISFIDKENFEDFLNEIKQSLSLFEYTVLSRYLLLGNYKDVCKSLGVSRKEIDNALQRARKKIKKLNS